MKKFSYVREAFKWTNYDLIVFDNESKKLELKV